MKATQGHGGANGRPKCYNGQRPTEYRANNGFDSSGFLNTVTIPWSFSTACASWKSDPTTDPVPLAEGWKCAGCRHFPVQEFAQALLHRERRKNTCNPLDLGLN